jgi:hypothetical protein
VDYLRIPVFRDPNGLAIEKTHQSEGHSNSYDDIARRAQYQPDNDHRSEAFEVSEFGVREHEEGYRDPGAWSISPVKNGLPRQ